MSIKSLKLAAREAGERFFDTGFPCKEGHISKRYASTGQCVECMTAKTSKPLTQYQELAGLQFFKPTRMLVVSGVTPVQLDALDLHLATCAAAWLGTTR